MVEVEDGSFRKGVKSMALLAAVLFKEPKIESVQTVKITVDGLDATEKLVNNLRGGKCEVVTLACVFFVGSDVVDPKFIHEKFEKPIIAISRTEPENKAVIQLFRYNLRGGVSVGMFSGVWDWSLKLLLRVRCRFMLRL